MSKRTLSAILLVPLVLVFAACSSLKLPGTTSTNANANPQQPGANFNFANQPLENKLAIGTLKLEETSQKISAEEAKNLLPLWKGVKSLTTSSTSSPEEIQAVYKQIEEAMTPDQVSTIKKLDLTGEDIQALMKQYNVKAPQGGNFGNLTPEQRATRAAQFRAQGGGNGTGTGGNRGNFQGGGFQGGGGNFQGGNNGQVAPQRTRTPGANPNRGGMRGGMNFLFVDSVINLLQQRAGS
jgi:hypothetical protein